VKLSKNVIAFATCDEKAYSIVLIDFIKREIIKKIEIFEKINDKNEL